MPPDAVPHRDEDLALLHKVRDLLSQAPVRRFREGGWSDEISESWYQDAALFWKDVYFELNRHRTRLQELMEHLLSDEDFPAQRTYSWRDSGELVPETKRRVIRDLPALLGHIRYCVPGQRSRKLALVLLDKMIDRLEGQVIGNQDPQPIN